jgi:hypothetical protein
MKRIIPVLIGASMLSATTAVTAEPPANSRGRALGPTRPEIKEYCLFLMSTGYYDFFNLGECMSYSSVSDQGFRTKFCDFLRETDQLDDNGYSSYSDCVTSLSQH